MNPLKEKILRTIRTQGPIGVAHYMQMALMDPEHGYYMRRDPFGAAGDFITAPEVSQIFGELIGLFFAQSWEDRGRPSPFHFVELGPGRGTLIADMLRAVGKVRPQFVAAANIVLVEASPILRAKQAEELAGYNPTWTDDFAKVPDDAPLFLVANEFFDALPVRQFLRSERGWHERMVAAEGEALRFVVAPDPVPADFVPAALRDAPPGAIFETSPAAQALARDIADRVAHHGGVALFIDYGHRHPGLGDTFQAVKKHAFADPLAAPGEADLTAHVDFAALAAAACEQEGSVFGPEVQGAFLEKLGINLRAEMLKKKTPAHAAEIDAALQRLTDRKGMGTLFKVMAICEDRSPGVPGLPC